MQLENIAVGVLTAWLVIVSVVLVWVVRVFKSLVKDTKGGNLIKVLDAVLKQSKLNSKDIKSIEKEIGRLDASDLESVRKVGLVRFNPFSELGGDHSFTLCLLDGKDNGFVITGLHTRERTRVYVKEIKKTKSRQTLSKEEKEVIHKALRGN